MAVEDLTRDLRNLVQMASKEGGVDHLLHFGLDWVQRLAPYDLATIFLLQNKELAVKAARGKLAGPKVMSHRLPLDEYPSILRILETRRARTFHEDDHAHGDGDPFDGVLDLPHGHACMVVPLCAGQENIGILTLDRASCGNYPKATVDLLEIYGQVLAMALLLAEQNERLKRLHGEARERERLLAHELSGNSDDLADCASNAMTELARRSKQVAQTNTPVLILGETGTGKERLANAIHAWSPRAHAPFVKINCAAIPENLLESELFGHLKGAFTGATRNRPGRFQMANGGTILLDEIGEMPLPLQAKLLRVLQEGTFEPVGSDRSVKVDVRVLAATHVDLAKAIEEKRFREDLYYRISVFPLTVPPLRHRLEDLPQLCHSLLADLAKRSGRQGLTVGSAGLEKLSSYTWPGNVRELGNVLERGAILAQTHVLGPRDLDLPSNQQPAERCLGTETHEEPILTLAEAERRHILRALKHSSGKIYGTNGAAEILDLKPSTLQSRMKKLGIRRKVVAT